MMRTDTIHSAGRTSSRRPLHGAALPWSGRAILLFAAGLAGLDAQADDPPVRPNVLFIAVDDLNDWIGPMDGNEQALTPNLDRLVKRGAMVFQNAHCAGPVCGPSRSALLSGYMPHRTGIYANPHQMLDADLVRENPTLPEYFSMHGYATASKGKIFHAHTMADGMDFGQWAFEEWEPREPGDKADPSRLSSRNRNLFRGKRLTGNGGIPVGAEFAWGPTLDSLEETADYKEAKWAEAQLQRDWDRPFFLAVGLFRPHLPFFVPQEFFDLYPLDEVKVPSYRLDDFDDILDAQGKPRAGPTADFEWVHQDPEMFKSAVQAYLACVSYADACLGVILDALERSPHRNNTIVVIWGDHGWHLGEKLRFRKAALWRESTRAPLLVRLPSMDGPLETWQPANLIDLYPTLVDLCGLPAREGIDGVSLRPLLADPETPVREASITVAAQHQVAVQTVRWHFIRYADGSEELYDLPADPFGFTNLAVSAPEAHREVLAGLRRHLPMDQIPALPDNPHVKRFDVGLSPTVGRDRPFLRHLEE